MWWTVGLATALTLACLACGTSAQSLCEFEMPESTIAMASASFSYRHYDDGRTPEVDSSTGRFTGRFERLHDAPSLGYTFWVNTQLDVDTWIATSWLTSGSISYRYYVSDELPLFVYAGVRVDAATGQLQPGCELRSGVGIGRFRDVTPLAKTFRIIEAISCSGGVRRALSSRAMIRIAEEVARPAEYESFEEYVAGVAELIGNSIGSPLDSAGVLIVRSELEEEAIGRYCGAILQGGVGYELIDPYAGPQDVLYVLSGDVGRALTRPIHSFDAVCRGPVPAGGSSKRTRRHSNSFTTQSFPTRTGSAQATSYGGTRRSRPRR